MPCAKILLCSITALFKLQSVRDILLLLQHQIDNFVWFKVKRDHQGDRSFYNYQHHVCSVNVRRCKASSEIGLNENQILRNFRSSLSTAAFMRGLYCTLYHCITVSTAIQCAFSPKYNTLLQCSGCCTRIHSHCTIAKESLKILKLYSKVRTYALHHSYSKLVKKPLLVLKGQVNMCTCICTLMVVSVLVLYLNGKEYLNPALKSCEYRHQLCSTPGHISTTCR